MTKFTWLAILLLAAASTQALGQARPYIGYAYPAGGQQGTSFRVKIGGQAMDDPERAIVSGTGVTAKVVEYRRKLGPIEMTVLQEQLRELRRTLPADALASLGSMEAMNVTDDLAAGMAGPTSPFSELQKVTTPAQMVAKLQSRMAEYTLRPASAAIADIAFLEVQIAPDAPPGDRELRVVTLRGGFSNPVVFNVGQVKEYCRKPMMTSQLQVLGKEELALRKRPPEEAEVKVEVPCICNGQVASGEVNRYRFEAKQGQKLVINVAARQLIPFIADAVPGWFQPVLVLSNAAGKELAYIDDYRFKPDPTIFFDVPKDGEYVLSIYDAIYRGREDFVYRLSIGETPFITGIFPMGGRAGQPLATRVRGVHIDNSKPLTLPKNTPPGVHYLTMTSGKYVTNRVPFVVDTLPETMESEPNNTALKPQGVEMPIIINGRIEKTDDWDVYRLRAKAGDTICVEVSARNLDSPLDSLVKITDQMGNVLAICDDREDVGAGANTHHADSYIMHKAATTGAYLIHVGDAGRAGGVDYSYRVRISLPRPDFALRLTPSSASMRGFGGTSLMVHALRKDGFDGPISLDLQKGGQEFFPSKTIIGPKDEKVNFSIRTILQENPPMEVVVVGTAKIDGKDVVRQAVPAEDRMQAFLWRHLVPAQDFRVVVWDPITKPTPKRVPPPGSQAERSLKAIEEGKASEAMYEGDVTAKPAVKPQPVAAKPDRPRPTFTRAQVDGRLRQLRLLYEEGLLTDEFYGEKVAECEVAE